MMKKEELEKQLIRTMEIHVLRIILFSGAKLTDEGELGKVAQLAAGDGGDGYIGTKEAAMNFLKYHNITHEQFCKIMLNGEQLSPTDAINEVMEPLAHTIAKQMFEDMKGLEIA